MMKTTYQYFGNEGISPMKMRKTRDKNIKDKVVSPYMRRVLVLFFMLDIPLDKSPDEIEKTIEISPFSIESLSKNQQEALKKYLKKHGYGAWWEK